MNFEIRKATEADTPLIAWFIRQLAEYERLLEETTMTEETLRESLFGPRSSTEVLLGYYEERPVAFAVFFHNFSTFVGKRGLYLEDLFVIPEMRGKGFGRALLVHLAKIARERNCGRFEWAVLDWNRPAIDSLMFVSTSLSCQAPCRSILSFRFRKSFAGRKHCSWRPARAAMMHFAAGCWRKFPSSTSAFSGPRQPARPGRRRFSAASPNS